MGCPLSNPLEGEQAENFQPVHAPVERNESRPTRRIEFYLKLLEFHKPKLNRTALTGGDGDAIIVEFSEVPTVTIKQPTFAG